jgi:hypothetical protein
MALYLLHWDPPLVGGRQPQHYLGWTSRAVEERVLDHLNDGPHAARIVVAAVEAGCEITLARVWPKGSRTEESAMKKAKKSFASICPVCQRGGDHGSGINQ